MGATKFRNRIKAVRPDITVKNTSVDNIPADCDIAVVQTVLAERAKKSCPKAQLVQIGNFLADPALDDLYIQVTTLDKPTETVVDDPSEATNTAASSVKMTPDCIMLNQPCKDRSSRAVLYRCNA